MSSPSSIPLSSVVPEGAVTEVPDVAEQIVPKPELSTIPPQYVIPITPDNQLSPALIPSYPSLGSTHERNFDHNDQKYQCCHGHMHITLAARVVSIAYLCTSLFAVSVAVTSQGVTFAFCSIASVAFTLAIFGTLAYGVFTEKQTFILPYIIFQVTSIICTVFIIIIFIIGSTFSNEMLNRLASDLIGTRIDHNTTSKFDIQMFGLLFALTLIALLLIQFWFMDIICRFRKFIIDREKSFSLNLASVLNNNDAFFSDFPSLYYEK